MGVLLRFFNLSQPTMKVLFIVALALAAVMAEPEAEPSADASPEAWYGHYYGGWPGYYGGYRGYGGYGGYYGHPYYRGKRSADAEPEAAAEATPDYGQIRTDTYRYGYYGLGHRAYYGGYYGHRYGYGYGYYG